VNIITTHNLLVELVGLDFFCLARFYLGTTENHLEFLYLGFWLFLSLEGIFWHKETNYFTQILIL
jgi:hypothetical protein